MDRRATAKAVSATSLQTDAARRPGWPPLFRCERSFGGCRNRHESRYIVKLIMWLSGDDETAPDASSPPHSREVSRALLARCQAVKAPST